jgi:hypothetical protein
MNLPVHVMFTGDGTSLTLISRRDNGVELEEGLFEFLFALICAYIVQLRQHGNSVSNLSK